MKGFATDTGKSPKGPGAEAMSDAERSIKSFDLRKVDRAFLDNPYPVYRALREQDPVHRLPDGSYFLTRYDDLAAVYRDRRFSSDKKVEFKPKFGDSPLYLHHTTSLVFNDPPYHTRVRKLLAPAFTPRAVRILEPRFAALVDRLIDEALVRGGMDVISDFASQLPVEIIGDMLAVPRDERGPLRDWSLAILGALEPSPSSEALDWGNRSVREFGEYLTGHIDRFRRGLLRGGDVLGMLLAEETDEGERLSDVELVQNCIFLLNAGHETTTNLIGNGIAALIDWPDQLERLRRDPTLIESAVEEFLRFESSNQLGNRRALERVEIGGVAMEPGTFVTLGIGAANRDPAQFPDPDRLDIARTPNRHLAFGSGIHACAGMSLARIEGKIAIGRLIERAPSIKKTGEFRRGGRARFRGFLSYPIGFG